MENKDIDINLNALAINSLNTASALWAIGGDFESASGFAFGGSSDPSWRRQLILTTQESTVVPAPGALALVGIGLLSLIWSRRKVRICREAIIPAEGEHSFSVMYRQESTH